MSSERHLDGNIRSWEASDIRGDSKLLSVVVPVRNEGKFIRGTLAALLAQDFPPNQFEIIVVDGSSTDDTVQIVLDIGAAHPQVRLLANPGKLSSAGRNVGVRNAVGRIVAFVDGHVHIPTRKLFANIIDCFQETNADCLSRPQPQFLRDNTPFQNAVAEARHCWVGHGLGSQIYRCTDGWVDPISAGAVYRKEVFEVVGYYDERFDAGEDIEFNYRVKRAGLRCYSRSDIAVHYYPRANFAALFRQMKRYGIGRARLLRKHPGAFTVGQLAPLGLYLGTLAAVLVGFFHSRHHVGAAIVWSVYLATAVLVTSRPTRPMPVSGRALMAMAILTIHAGLAWGNLIGWLGGRAFAPRKKSAKRGDNLVPPTMRNS